MVVSFTYKTEKGVGFICCIADVETLLGTLDLLLCVVGGSLYILVKSLLAITKTCYLQ